MCDGGVDPGPPPDQLYPGQVTVPAGCNCRTCHGCTYVVVDPVFADIVVCRCRRCACMSPTYDNLGPITGISEVKSSPKSCCGSRKMVWDKLDISPSVNSQTEFEDQVVKVLAVPYSATSADKDRSICCSKMYHLFHL